MLSSVWISVIKKTLFHPKADELSRLIFQEKLFQYRFIEKRPIVYLDESGFAVDMPRERGYSPKGKKWAQAKSLRRKFGYTTEQIFICENI